MITATIYAPGLTVSVLPTGATGSPTGGTGPTGSPGTLTLTRLSPSNPSTVYGGYNFQFGIATVMPGGKIHQVWGGTNEFDAVTGAWTLKTVSMSDGSAVPTKPENFGQQWVPSEAVVYQGTQTPGGLFNRFDPATGVYTNVPGATAGDDCLLYDAPRNRLLSFGGYVYPSSTLHVFPVPGGPWSTTTTANAPPITQDYAKLCIYRATISSLGNVGMLADGNEVYELPPAATAWVHQSATGTKPPNYSHFVYYEPADCYIAWCGANTVAGSGTTPAVGAFYVLPRATWAWQQLTISAAHLPTNRSLAASFLLADPERQQVLLFGAAGYTELFALDLRGLL